MNCILCERITRHQMSCCQKPLCSGCLLQTFQGDHTTCAHCRSALNMEELISNNYCDRCDANTLIYCSQCGCYLCDGCWDIIHSGRKLSLHQKGTQIIDKKPLYEALALNAHNMNLVQKDIDSLHPESINKTPTLRRMVEGQIEQEFNRLYELLCVRRTEAFKLVDERAMEATVMLKTEYVDYQKAQSDLQTQILDGSELQTNISPYVSKVKFEFNITHREIAPLIETVDLKGTYY